MDDVLLRVTNLRVCFDTRFGLVEAVNGVDLQIRRGESVGIVGESGSGKSVTALSILRLLDKNAKLSADEIYFDGEDILHKSEADMRKFRGRRVSMIFQDPMSSLNPVLTVGRQVEETISIHNQLRRGERKRKVINMFNAVGIPNAEFNRRSYPHEFSGGMNQRIMIAMALSCHPSLMIADEPTTALDVTTQAQILELLKTLMREEKAALLMITHDLGIVREVCERVCVMYGGKIVEEGLVQEVLFSPLHPYTKGLINCIPKLKGTLETLSSIPGDVPRGTDLPPGCAFHPRCDLRNEICAQKEPDLISVEDHKVRCFLLGSRQDQKENRFRETECNRTC